MKLKFCCLLLGLILAVGFANTSWAVPSLGVATYGMYYVGPGDIFEDYQKYFASGSASADDYNDGNEGFLVGASGDDLIVFTNRWERVGEEKDKEVDIYLLTTVDVVGKSLTLTLGEGSSALSFGMIPSNQADGYKLSPYGGNADYGYYGVNLGPVLDSAGKPNSGWQKITDSAFPGTYYQYSAPLTYSGGDLPLGSYFFSAADSNGSGGLYFNNKDNPEGIDAFSPKTSSAVTTAVPEPNTILLLATGLGSLCAYGSRRKKKRK